MATVKAIFNAPRTTDVWTITVTATWSAGDTATITGLGKTLVTTIGSLTTVAQVATTIKEAFNGSTFTDTTASCLPLSPRTALPEFAELTATATSTTVILTANTAGRSTPTFTVSDTAASGAVSIAHTKTASGPTYWDDPLNWDTGAVPVAADDVIIDQPGSFTDGLAQSAVTLTSLTIKPTFDSSSAIGRPQRNPNGYNEYRATELAISATTVNITTGSGLIKINYGSVANTTTVWASGTATESGRTAIQLRGTNTGNVLNCLSLAVSASSSVLNVGWGSNGEASNVATVRQDAGTLTIGTAVSSLATFTQNGTGPVSYVSSACTTYTSTGTSYNYGGAITTLNVNSGTFYDFGSATYTTVNLNNSGVYNADGAIASKTITNCNMNDTSVLVDTSDRITFTNAIAWKGRITLATA